MLPLDTGRWTSLLHLEVLRVLQACETQPGSALQVNLPRAVSVAPVLARCIIAARGIPQGSHPYNVSLRGGKKIAIPVCLTPLTAQNLLHTRKHIPFTTARFLSLAIALLLLGDSE